MFFLKIRYIIEHEIGVLKKNKSLDNIRNSALGHNGIDYRIACAMNNFTHKPLVPDGENMEQIAYKILEKSRSMRKNKLQFLLKKQLDTSLIKNSTRRNK